MTLHLYSSILSVWHGIRAKRARPIMPQSI
jgi:hypothetical protein